MGLATIPVDPALPTLVAPTPVTLDLPDGPPADPEAELDRQVDTYVALGIPEVLGQDEATFRAAVEPLRQVLPKGGAVPGVSGDDGIGFVLVVPVDVNDAVPAMRRGDRRGVSVIGPDEAAGYRPLPDVDVPPGFAYLLTGIDTGSEFCGVPPEQALVAVRERSRTPVTLTEGVALVIVRPDMLRPGRCFSLMGSRAADQRVPAIWISRNRPKLGWCWDRNPHTWLGAASAQARLGIASGAAQ